MSHGAVFRRREIAEVVTGAGAALLVLDGRLDPRPMVLNDTAFLIWQRVPHAGIPVREVASWVAQQVGLSPAEIIDDVVRFIDELEEQGLVMRRVGDASEL